ncbi:MAG: nitroreductase [Gammaproteobacteria bacterium]|nr:nitroreductase [Gammaproteobacteria bacterium]MBU1408124.1 nitroreductase [Gammaproteobacteria bacterium]MBU1532821.1 nitroreductase [Gammaproteobacteria bacterium]
MVPTPWSLTRDMASELISAAVLAPSSHNTQPWIFRVRGPCIDLLADRTRALPANDPDDRELTISCACALFNLRVAAAHARLAATLHRPAGLADPDCLATVELAPALESGAALAALFEAVASRRTYRKTFAARPVAAGVLDTLAEATRLEGAWLHPLTGDAQRRRAAELVAEGDEMQWDDPAWRRELAAWMHPRHRGDGLALPGLAVPLAQAVVRTFDMGHGVGARDRQLADASPVLAILGTPGDGLVDWIAAGQALQRLLLTAHLHGLQASYLNQPIEVAPLRPRLQQLTWRPGFTQLLLRLGYPEGEVPAAPRRPLAEVIETPE